METSERLVAVEGLKKVVRERRGAGPIESEEFGLAALGPRGARIGRTVPMHMAERNDESLVRLPLTEARAGGAATSAVTPQTIREIVDEFYAKCRSHPELGPVFEAHVKDWGKHLATIRAFWEAVVLRSGGYAGRPLEAHLAIPDLGPVHFSSWLRLFAQTVAAHCSEEDAAIFMDRAGRMANRIMSKGALRGSGPP